MPVLETRIEKSQFSATEMCDRLEIFPFDVVDIYRMLPDRRYDVLAPSKKGGARYLPLRLLLPSETGYAIHPRILVRASRGDLVSYHCYDSRSRRIFHEAGPGDPDGPAMEKGFTDRLENAGSPTLPLVERQSDGLIVGTRRMHPRSILMERRFQPFDDFRVILRGSDCPAPFGLEARSVFLGRLVEPNRRPVDTVTICNVALSASMVEVHRQVATSIATEVLRLAGNEDDAAKVSAIVERLLSSFSIGGMSLALLVATERRKGRASVDRSAKGSDGSVGVAAEGLGGPDRLVVDPVGLEFDDASGW